MIRKRNNMNGIKSTIGWVISLLLLGVLTYFSVVRKENAVVEDVRIQIHSPKGKKSLLTSKEVKHIFKTYLGYEINLSKVKELQLIELEEILDADERVEKAEIYVDGNNALSVDVIEKNVVVRVKGKGISYYLDDRGDKIQIRKNRTVRVPIATGKIEEYSNALFLDKKRSNLEDVWNLALEIEKDKFLSALIEQIDIDRDGNITMIPKIGRERITLTATDLKEKLFNLKVFYKDGLPKKGWSKYASLNLDIKGQVVAEKLDNN